MLNRQKVEAVIPNAGTDSAAVSVPNNKTLLGFKLPSAFTGTSISFKMQHESGDTAIPVYNGSTLYTITVAGASPGRYYYVDPVVFRGCSYLTLVSGSAEAAARTIELIFGNV